MAESLTPGRHSFLLYIRRGEEALVIPLHGLGPPSLPELHARTTSHRTLAQTKRTLWGHYLPVRLYTAPKIYVSGQTLLQKTLLVPNPFLLRRAFRYEVHSETAPITIRQQKCPHQRHTTHPPTPAHPRQLVLSGPKAGTPK